MDPNERAIKALARQHAAGRVEVAWYDGGRWFVRVYPHPSSDKVREMALAKLEASTATALQLSTAIAEAQNTVIMQGIGGTILEAVANVAPR